jgi:DNA-binding response OmpR family regulator
MISPPSSYAASCSPQRPRRPLAGAPRSTVDPWVDWTEEIRAPRILLAEDDLEMRAMLADVLSRDGYEVIEARHGAELHDLLIAQRDETDANSAADLIISDLRMPIITGLDVHAWLREHDSETPFILITAFGGEELAAQSLSEGVAAVFDKPFDIDALRAKVAILLGRHLPEPPQDR